MPHKIPPLRTIFDGQVIAPNDARYDEARTVFYGGIDMTLAAGAGESACVIM